MPNRNFFSFLCSFFLPETVSIQREEQGGQSHHLSNSLLVYLAKHWMTKAKVGIFNLELFSRAFTLEVFRKYWESLLKGKELKIEDKTKG